jgi:hypothetical protein
VSYNFRSYDMVNLSTLPFSTLFEAFGKMCLQLGMFGGNFNT